MSTERLNNEQGATGIDGGITIGAKHYQSPDELKAEKDETQIVLIKKAVMVKESTLLVWLSGIYGDNIKSADTFGNLSIPEQFFLMGIMPFLSYKEFNGSIRALQDLIDSCPGRYELFETYARQGLPLAGQNCGNKKTPIDYAVCNFNALSVKHGADAIHNLIRLLCKLGADVNEHSGNGAYPLLNAHNAKNDDLVKLLMELGADENQYKQIIEQERIERERKAEQEKKDREQRERRAEQERIERERKAEQEKKDREERERQRREEEARIAKEKARNKRKAIVRKTILIMAPLVIVTSGAIFFVVRQKNIEKEMKREFTTVSAEILPVRGEPSINSEPPIDEITKDTRVEVLERYDDPTWVQISYGDGKTGFVNSEHLWRAAGLYEGEMYRGNMGLQKAANWLINNAKDNGNYTIVLGKNEAVKFVNFSYEQKTMNITLIPAGAGLQSVQYSNSEPKHSLFSVGPGVTLIMEDGINLVGNQGGIRMVSVKRGNFIMNGGSIRSGGGVAVSESGAFTMNNGIISGNTSTNGAGVYIINSTFTMNDGTISENTAKETGGGIIIKKGTFTMNNGTISKNAAESGGGGGVAIAGGNFIMNNGTITGNSTISSSGGGVCITNSGREVRIGGIPISESGNFTMNNGIITGNTATYGGGVDVGGGTFTMNSGNISLNTALVHGGGVGVNYNATFTIKGGTITGNIARNYGGGVMIFGNFTKTGGTITGYNSDRSNGNVVKKEDSSILTSRGHAIYVNENRRKETTVGPSLNLSGSTARGWQ